MQRNEVHRIGGMRFEHPPTHRIALPLIHQDTACNQRSCPRGQSNMKRKGTYKEKQQRLEIHRTAILGYTCQQSVNMLAELGEIPEVRL